MLNSYFTWSMAEELAVAHMREIGFADAKRTPQGTDGGIDVMSAQAVAQVKFHTAPIGLSEIQRLSGIAGTSRRAIFYSSSGYTASAHTWAAERDVALFFYTTENKVTAKNQAAVALSGRTGRETLHPFERAANASDKMKEFGLRGSRWALVFSDHRIWDYIEQHGPRVDPEAGALLKTIARQKRENIDRDTDAVGKLLDELSVEMQDEDFDAAAGLRRLAAAEEDCRRTWKFNNMNLDMVLPQESLFEWHGTGWQAKA